MGVQDAQLHIGKEVTPGTAVTPTRSFEAKTDGHKRRQAQLRSRGMRAGMHTTRSDRARQINMGAEGPLELDVLTKGFGLLFEQMLGTTATLGAAISGATLQTHQSSSDGPVGKAMTVQVGKPPVSGAVLPFTYSGGKVKSWELSQKVGEYLSLKLDMDYVNEDTATSLLGVPVYPAGSDPFDWTQIAATINGTAVDVTELSIKGDNALDTDRRYMRSSALKREQLRKGEPKYSGMVKADFADLTQYNRFIAGTIVPIVFTWTGASIGAGQSFQIIVTLSACQFTGDTPEVSLDALPTQPLPFDVLWDGTNPAVKITYNSTDTAV